MNGLRYYVGSLIICAASTHAAQEYVKKDTKSLRVKIQTTIPSPHKLYTSARTFCIDVTNTTTTIAAVKKLFEQEIDKLARKEEPTCCCGGPCADVRAAKAIAKHLVDHKDKSLQIAFLREKTEDTATLESLRFAEDDVLYAQY